MGGYGIIESCTSKSCLQSLESCLSRRVVSPPSKRPRNMTSLTADDLTKKRQKIAAATETVESEFTGEDHRFDDREFARSQLNEVFAAVDLTEVIGEEDEEGERTLQTTTDLLNKMTEEDGIFKKTQQGGDSAFVLDTRADEDKDEQVTGVTASDLAEMANQIQRRTDEHIPLGDVDFSDWGDVISTVNGALGRPELVIKSEPNLYRLTDAARKAIRKEL